MSHSVLRLLKNAFCHECFHFHLLLSPSKFSFQKINSFYRLTFFDNFSPLIIYDLCWFPIFSSHPSLHINLFVWDDPSIFYSYQAFLWAESVRFALVCLSSHFKAFRSINPRRKKEQPHKTRKRRWMLFAFSYALFFALFLFSVLPHPSVSPNGLWAKTAREALKN